MARARQVKLGAGLVVLAAAVAAVGFERESGAASPAVSLPTAQINRSEGSAVSTVTVTATLSAPSPTPVTVSYTTAPGSAKATDADYVTKKGTLSFAPGVVTRPITVQINGDTKLEEHEIFRVKLTKPVGAALGNFKQAIQLQNDELPNVVIKPMTVNPGKVVAFKAKLGKRFHQALTLTARTVNGTASAPGDFTAVSKPITYAAGKKGTVTVKVATVANLISEPTETFRLEARTSVAMLGSGTATITGAAVPPPTTPTTIGTTTTTPTAPPQGAVCPAGSTPTTPVPGAPSSPSTAQTLLPPPALTGGEPWDLVFQDEFHDQAYFNSKWSTGMRSGDRTLESNTELQWYMPANSTLTTDSDGSTNLGVLRQTLQKQAVAGTDYTVRTLSRIYPPSLCPAYYHSNGDNSTSSSNTSPTKTQYQFTSGMINNSKSFGFKYGYVETRVKMPKGFALWPALWLRDWKPWSYEIDVFEVFDRSSRTFRTSYWWGDANHRGTENDGGDIGLSAGGGPCRGNVPIPATTSSASSCSLANAVDLSAGYHTIGLSWTATKYELYLDGVKRWTSPAGADVADTYNHLILNLALGNSSFEFDWTDEPVKPFDPNLFSSTYFPKRTIEWDYVRVWQPANARDVCIPPNCN